jgi:hypothetical protein
MRAISHWAACVMLAVMSCSAQNAVTQGWSTYENSRYKFAVQYPSSWRGGRAPDSPGLFISNFPASEEVRGVVIPRTGAQITVLPAPEDIRNKESWIKRDLAGEKELLRREIPVAKESTGKCSELTQVTWEWEVGPKTYFTETAYYCSAANRLFRIRLTHWKDNPRNEELQSTALEMAKTLTVR